jgi:heptosyltransferase-2
MKWMKIIIRVPNWIGDAVLSLPAIESMKLNFPDAEIWVAASEWVKDLFSPSDGFPKIIPIPPLNDMRTFRAFGREIKKRDFDVGILLTNSFSSALLFYLARIPHRWGYRRDGRRVLLTKSVPLKETDASVHQLNYYLNLLAGLGLKTSSPEIGLKLTPEEKGEAGQIILSAGLDPAGPLIIFDPGASYGPAKRWPATSYAALGNMLQARTDAQILLIGSPDEDDLARKIAAGMGKKPASFVGKTTLRQLASLISLSHLFVTNDTGPMHLANALRVPVVAIFGPTDPGRTGPFFQPARVLRKEVPCWPCLYRKCPYDHRCMTTITPEEVFEICQKISG